MATLHKTHVWDIVHLPLGKSTIGCKWISKINTRADGSIDRYNVWLAVKGYTIPRSMTLTTLKMTAIRTVLVASTIMRWPPYPPYQMHVKIQEFLLEWVPFMKKSI